VVDIYRNLQNWRS
jgi:hypothetical protein